MSNEKDREKDVVAVEDAVGRFGLAFPPELNADGLVPDPNGADPIIVGAEFSAGRAPDVLALCPLDSPDPNRDVCPFAPKGLALSPDVEVIKACPAILFEGCSCADVAAACTDDCSELKSA